MQFGELPGAFDTSSAQSTPRHLSAHASPRLLGRIYRILLNNSCLALADRKRAFSVKSMTIESRKSSLLLSKLSLILLVCFVEAAPQSAFAEDHPKIPIEVVGHDWHTGIVIPVNNDALELCPALERFKGDRFVEIGWGDYAFYTTDSISVVKTVRALFWPTPTVLHLFGYDEPTLETFPDADIVRLELTAEEFRALLRTLNSCFASDWPFSLGHYENSFFYSAKGTYFFTNTCNVWTLRTLRSASVSTIPWAGLRSEAAMHQLTKSGTPLRLEERRRKWPYAIASLVGFAIVARRRARFHSHFSKSERGEAEADPSLQDQDSSSRDRGLLRSWGFVVGTFVVLMVISVFAANHFWWALILMRSLLALLVAALASVVAISFDRIRSGYRSRRRFTLYREWLSALFALFFTAAILSPM